MLKSIGTFLLVVQMVQIHVDSDVFLAHDAHCIPF